jgi:hypothetical protein
MYRSPTGLTVIAVSSLLLVAHATDTHAQAASNDVIARCAQAVGQMKFDGWPADRNREMMIKACEHNGGEIPGAAQHSPVSLPQHHSRQHSQ